MQAVILAGGKSTRTYPLTLTKPKPLLKVVNKTILEYNLDAIGKIVKEIILVVGYKKDMIKNFIKKNYPDLKITYIEQHNQLGTGHAVSILKNQIKNKFILLMGDNIYSKGDIEQIAKHQFSILVKTAKNWQDFGVVKEENNVLVNLIEKPKEFISNIINCGLYSLDNTIFDILKTIKKSERGEYELTDGIKKLSKTNRIYCIKSKLCLQISYPWDLLCADRQLRGKKNICGDHSIIDGIVNNSTIGNNCIIKGNVKNSIIMDNTLINKNSIIEDSVVGANVNFTGKIIAKSNILSNIKNKKIKVDRMGAIIGDNVLAEDVVIKTGCKIWPNKIIRGEINHDIR